MSGIKLGVVMDELAKINYKKDSTLAMLFETQRRGWEIYCMQQQDLFLQNGAAFARCKKIRVFENENKWFEVHGEETLSLSELQVILMRKDPPFNLEFIYTTYLLEQAEKQGVLVVNKPQALRDANEKMFTSYFPQCCPPTLVTSRHDLLREFLSKQRDIICKPLDGMGGSSVFRVSHNDLNASVIFETLTYHQTQLMMAQKFIPEISAGDKRIILVNGEPISFALARIPAKGELRGNLAAGATGVIQPLSARDKFICAEVGPALRERGLLFVGLDVIGDYLTEINVTSPTGIREIEAHSSVSICKQLFDLLQTRLQ